MLSLGWVDAPCGDRSAVQEQFENDMFARQGGDNVDVVLDPETVAY